MSVAETVRAQIEITWNRLTEIAPLPAPVSAGLKWDIIAMHAGREARKDIWIRQDNSEKSIQDACERSLRKYLKGDDADPLKGPFVWHLQLTMALKKDPLIRELPTIEGVESVFDFIEEWWPEHWDKQDKSDTENALSMSEVVLEVECWRFRDQANATLARLLWLERLRTEFPGCPVTRPELRKLQHQRQVFAAGEKYSAGLNTEQKSAFDESLGKFINGDLSIPVASSAESVGEFGLR